MLAIINSVCIVHSLRFPYGGVVILRFLSVLATWIAPYILSFLLAWSSTVMVPFLYTYCNGFFTCAVLHATAWAYNPVIIGNDGLSTILLSIYFNSLQISANSIVTH